MLGDTIVAQASAAGASERAVVRLSGPRAIEAAATVFSPALGRQRVQVEGEVRVGSASVPALALVMVAPRSFTGEDVVELHVPGSPLLVRLLVDTLLADGPARGVRLAVPGEFTARACRNGRLDLAQAEGVLMLLHAGDQQEAAAAVQWLRGGLSQMAGEVRAGLQDALALLEVGLDFADGETGEVPEASWRQPLHGIAERLRSLLASLPLTAPGGEVLLLGRSNAGKSSLANALLGRGAAIVADAPGTTRDLLRLELEAGMALWDAPGDLDTPAAVDRAALELRERLQGRAAAVLCVLDATAPAAPPSVLETALPWLGVVWTKCDLVGTPPALPPAVAERAQGVPVFATSAALRTGLEPLRERLRRSARAGVVDAGGPLRTGLEQASLAVQRATLVVGGAELVAVELHAALAALDGIGGQHDHDQLLDRIYGRFCLGK